MSVACLLWFVIVYWSASVLGLLILFCSVVCFSGLLFGVVCLSVACLLFAIVYWSALVLGLLIWFVFLRVYCASMLEMSRKINNRYAHT